MAELDLKNEVDAGIAIFCIATANCNCRGIRITATGSNLRQDC